MKESKNPAPKMPKHDWDSMVRMAMLPTMDGIVKSLIEINRHKLDQGQKDFLHRLIKEAKNG